MKQKTFLSFLMLLLLFTGCQSKKTQEDSMQKINLNFGTPPLTLDPRKSGDYISSTFIFMLYEGLTKITPKSTHDLGLAEKIDLSEDKTIYTFHLKDAKWSNGDPVTAYDFEFAWKKILSPDFPAPNSQLLYPIKNAFEAKQGEKDLSEVGIEVVDDKTLKVTLKQPTPYFLELTSFCTYFPVPHKIVKENPQWVNGLSSDLVSCGPFEMTAWKNENYITLKKNPNYHLAEGVTLEEIHCSFVEDDLVGFNMFLNHDIDLTGLCFGRIPNESIKDLKAANKLFFVPMGASVSCSFNLDVFPINHPKIRHALSLAIDRDAIIRNICELNETVASQFIPPILKYNDQTPYFETYNPKKAKELFCEALKELNISLKDFPNLSYIYASTFHEKKLAQAIQSQWRENLGLDVQLIGYDYKTYLTKLIHHDYQLGQSLWLVQYNDPMDIFDRFRFKSNQKNYTNWESDEFKKYLSESEKQTTPRNRQKFLDLAEEVLAKEMPLTPIYHQSAPYAAHNHVKNLFISPIGSIHFDHVKIEK